MCGRGELVLLFTGASDASASGRSQDFVKGIKRGDMGDESLQAGSMGRAPVEFCRKTPQKPEMTVKNHTLKQLKYNKENSEAFNNAVKQKKY